MRYLEAAIDALYVMPYWEASLWLLLENVLIMLLSVLVGNLLVARYKAHPVAAPPRSSGVEVLLAVVSVLLNSTVTVLGLYLWRQGIIVVRGDAGLRAWLDVLVLFLGMDLAMYILHRMAHIPLLYPLFHQTHHRFEDPRPLTLFALNPLENLSFGLLWLLVLCLYEASWLGIAVYLTLNVAFGLIGHLGVEPFPQWWVKVPVVRQISTSTFHAQHHKDGGHNFGFYTLIWDRLFGTLSPRYADRFGQMPSDEETAFVRTE